MTVLRRAWPQKCAERAERPKREGPSRAQTLGDCVENQKKSPGPREVAMKKKPKSKLPAHIRKNVGGKKNKNGKREPLRGFVISSSYAKPSSSRAKVPVGDSTPSSGGQRSEGETSRNGW